jgi:hypothetical protein
MAVRRPPFRNLGSLFQVRQYLVRMAVCFDVFKDVLNFAIRPDHERRSGNALHLLAIHILFLDDAEGFADSAVLVGEQRVRQVVFVLETFLGLGCVARNAEHHHSQLLHLLVCVAEPARFNRSTRGVSLRVEEKDHGFPFEILQGNLFAVLIL